MVAVLKDCYHRVLIDMMAFCIIVIEDQKNMAEVMNVLKDCYERLLK